MKLIACSSFIFKQTKVKNMIKLLICSFVLILFSHFMRYMDLRTYTTMRRTIKEYLKFEGTVWIILLQIVIVIVTLSILIRF